MRAPRFLALLPVLAVCAMVLSGCGFRPLHGRHADDPGVTAELAAVAVAPMPDRTGQLLRNAMEQRLERAGGGRPKSYNLVIVLDETTVGLGLGRDATVTRANLVLTASFNLLKDGNSVWAGTSQSSAAFNMLNQQYATIISERDGRDRAVNQIADDITRRLAVFLGNRPKP
jgi:LPS-assembly lipoprotein